AVGLRRPQGADRRLRGRRPRHLGRDAADHPEPARRAGRPLLMRRLLAVVVLAALVALFLTRAEPFAPSVTLEPPLHFGRRASTWRAWAAPSAPSTASARTRSAAACRWVTSSSPAWPATSRTRGCAWRSSPSRRASPTRGRRCSPPTWPGTRAGWTWA